MPARRSGLRRVAMAPRRTPLVRSTKGMRLHSPVSPAERCEERAARWIVRQRSGGVCEVQVSPTICLGRATNFHHRLNRSLGGRWSAANGLHVCGSGSTGCHGWVTEHPAGAAAKGWSVPSWANPSTVIVMYRRVMVLLTDDGRVLPQWIGGGAR